MDETIRTVPAVNRVAWLDSGHQSPYNDNCSIVDNSTILIWGGFMMARGLRPLEKMNLRDHILEELRGVILDGDYKPGERLVEMTIADQLQVSRAPVREALSALEQEGIVVQIARRGYFVVDFSEKDIEEVYSLRLLLEVEALARGAVHARQEDYAQMQNLVDSLAAASRPMVRQPRIVEADLSFHEFICRLADHSRLLFAWNSLRRQTQMLLGITSRTYDDQPDEPRQRHQRILDYMKGKDIEKAQQVLVDHMQDAQERALRTLRTYRSMNGSDA
jgi:DNA-binding GntR family transcriptional regulator